MKAVRSLFILFALIVGFIPCGHAKERTVVRVGAYAFAPYYDSDKGTGVLREVLGLLNQSQSDYKFEVVEVPAKRRYQFYQEHRFDIMFFEDPKWNWQSVSHYSIPLELKDGDVYVALNKKNRGQEYFNSLKGKRIAGILGYHYAFAGYETDENLLRSKFDIYLVNRSLASMRLMLSERVDVAVVPKSYIAAFLRDNPEDRNKIMISDKYDQTYDLNVLANPKAPIPRPVLENLIKKVRSEARYQSLFPPVL